MDHNFGVTWNKNGKWKFRKTREWQSQHSKANDSVELARFSLTKRRGAKVRMSDDKNLCKKHVGTESNFVRLAL
jgi:hypothetical protein